MCDWSRNAPRQSVVTKNLARFDRGLDGSLVRARFAVLESVCLKGEPEPMSDPLWTILADLVVIVFGPWAIIRFTSRCCAKPSED